MRSLHFALLVSVAAHGMAALVWYGPEEPVRVPPVLAASLRPPVSAPEKPRAPAAAAPAGREQGRKARPTPVATPAVLSFPAAAEHTVSVEGPRVEPLPRHVAVAEPAPIAVAPAIEPPRFDAAYLANPPPDYPRSARRRGIEGTVLLEARISPAGEAREVKLAVSAGDAALDEAALAAVRGWRFVPARRGQEAVEAWVKIPVVFRLN